MSERLVQFLRCRDLDDAMSLAAGLGELTPDEHREVQNVLADASDVQAVANLLMEPSLIDARDRAGTLLRYLCGPRDSYQTLAACVGVEQLRPEDTVERQDAEIAAALADLSAGDEPEATVQRASVALTSFARSAPFDRLVSLLDHDDPVVGHNALAAIIDVVGIARAAEVLRHRVRSGSGSAERSGEQLAELEAAALLTPDEAALSAVVLPELSYIPSLGEWPS